MVLQVLPSLHRVRKPPKVCSFWMAGRCKRHPCHFLHCDPLAPMPRRSYVWRNPNSSRPPSSKPCAQETTKAARAQETSKPATQCQEEVAVTSTDPYAIHVEGAAKPGQEGAGGGPQSTAVCGFFLAGKCRYGEHCRHPHAWSIGDGFSHVATLEGHNRAVTGIALPSGSNKLFTGSKDGSVRIWDCATGMCVRVINLGVEIGCMINKGPWVFVGIPDAVKAWNTENGADLSLAGPKGQVYALVTSDDTLFAGAQDGIIVAWKSGSAGNHLEPSGSLTGHQGGVVALVVGAGRLYSGSMDHTIKVWELSNLQCIHTLTKHTSVVMSMLCWDQYLLSCSLDQTVKVWAATESGELEVIYTHNEAHGLLALFGMYDNQAEHKPVLFVSCNDNSIRLYDLPTFIERGRIFVKEEARAMQLGPEGLFFTGDGAGEMKVWKWLTSEKPATA